jgi:hypothetical protein
MVCRGPLEGGGILEVLYSRGSAAQKVKHKGNQRQHKQDVDQKTRGVEHYESTEPQ